MTIGDVTARARLIWSVVACGLIAGVATTATFAAPPEVIAGGDWPTYRHDAALSAVSPLAGGLGRAPRLRWSVDLGGPRVPSDTVLIRDVTGDGRDEILTLGRDSMECRDASGRRSWWLEGYPIPSVLDIRDFAGDGSRGILLSTTRGGRVEVFMVSGRSGRPISLWVDENNFGGHTRFGKLLAGVRGAQVASTASGQTPPAPHGGRIRLVSFENGLDRPRFRIRQSLPGEFYSPLMLFDDLDGDGALEMVVVSHEGLWSFDTDSGRLEFTAQYAPAIRTYSAAIASVKLAHDDAHPSLVMINPHIPGLEAVRQDGRSRASRLWKAVVGEKEDQYQSAIQIAPGATDVVADLDGDGRYEVLASITNEHGDGSRHLVVFDASNGARLAESGDERIVSIDDLDGDGAREVMLSGSGRLRVARWNNRGFGELWRGDGVEPLVRPLPPEGSLSRTSGGNMPVWRESPGAGLFLFRFPDGVSGCRLAGGQVVRVKPIASHEALGNFARSDDSDAERVTWDGKAAVVRRGSTEVFRYEPPAPQTYLAPPPLVADLGRSRQVLVRDAAGQFLLVPPSGGPTRVLIERAFERFQTHVDPAGAGPAIWDMDGDGENDIVATLTGGDGKPFCAILDAMGRIKRRFDLEPGTSVLNRGPTGSLGPGRGRWIVLRMFSLDGPYQGRRPLVVAFNGKTGRRLWVRDSYGGYGPNPVVFAAHLPTAVHDFDGDGAEDWLVCSENFYGVISVADNRELVGPVVLSGVIPGHWTAYSYPSLGKVRAAGEPALLHNNAYALGLITDLRGQPLWHEGMTRDTAGTWGILADLDGDGLSEFIHAQPDGLIRCFGVGTIRSLCAACPPGTPASSVPPANADACRWSIDLKQPVSRMAAADLDGDGRHELVLGCSDGKLYALAERAAQGRILWTVPLGSRVGEPVLADLDGDSHAEILVTAEAGRLYCLGGERNPRN
jgi:outer membrane protein assembly factor BamB